MISVPTYRRKGQSLLEMTLVISVVTGILATSGVVLQTVYKNHELSTRQLLHQRALQLLGQRWQEDVHAASSASMISNQAMEIQGVKSRLVYRLDANHNVIRQNWKNSKLAGEDRFPIGQPVDVAFIRDDQGIVPVLGIRVDSKAMDQPKALTTIYARLGIDGIKTDVAEKQRSGNNDAR